MSKIFFHVGLCSKVLGHDFTYLWDLGFASNSSDVLEFACRLQLPPSVWTACVQSCGQSSRTVSYSGKVAVSVANSAWFRITTALHSPSGHSGLE